MMKPGFKIAVAQVTGALAALAEAYLGHMHRVLQEGCQGAKRNDRNVEIDRQMWGFSNVPWHSRAFGHGTKYILKEVFFGHSRGLV